MDRLTDNSPVKKRRSRGVLRWLMRSITTILAAALLFFTYIFHLEPNWYDVHAVSLTLPHLPAAFDNYRIVQLADFHVDNERDVERLQKIVQMTAEQQPNLVVLTGDYITEQVRSTKVDNKHYDTMPKLNLLEMITNLTGGKDRRPAETHFPTLASGLRELSAPDGVIAILGNHDHWADNSPFMKILEDLKIQVLKNDVTKIQRGQDYLQIAGVRDFLMKEADLKPILAKLDSAPGAILLAHEPDFADISAATGKFDLQLSGHSHGGQVHIPGMKRITPPLAYKYPAGQYQVKQMIQYTSRGVGIVTPRVRFNCRPEITVLTLRSATGQAS
jgi:uncharacterized protein